MSPRTERDLAVLIVSYRRADMLDRALAAVDKWLPEARVHVWDNRSAETPAVAELAARHPSVAFSYADENLGYVAAMNRLMAQVPDCDALQMHADVELTGPLTRARAALTEPGVAVVAPTVEDADGVLEPWDVARREPAVLRDLADVVGASTALRGRAVSDLYPAAPSRVDGYLTGGALLVSRDAWDALGPVDERYFHDAEAPWQRAARDAGWTLRLVADTEPQARRGGAGVGTAGDRHAAEHAEWSADQRRAARSLVLGTSGNRGPGRTYSAGALLLDRAVPLRRAQRRHRRAAKAGSAGGRPEIVLVTNGLALGGAERQRALLANELVARGHPVTVVPMQHLGVHTGELDPRVRLLFQPWWQPVVDVGTEDAIIVGGGTRTEIGFAMAWRAQARVAGGRRWWLQALHDPAVLDGPTFSDTQARAMRTADARLVLSEQHQVDLTRHQDLGSRVMVAPNGIPAAPEVPFAPDPDGPLRFGMLSRIKEYKNPLLLAHALDALGEQHARAWTLEIFGEGPDRARLEAETPDHLRDRVHWRGPSPGPDHAFSEMDVLCLPSGFEAFPMAIVEALTRGVPVMASASGTVPDMLDFGRAGVVVEPVTREAWTAALAGVVDDRERLAALGRAGRARAMERYTVSAMTDDYQRAFARVLGRPIPGGPAGEARIL